MLDERIQMVPDSSPRIGQRGIAKSGGYSVMGSAGVLYWFG